MGMKTLKDRCYKMPCPTSKHKDGRMAGLWNEDWGNGNEIPVLLPCPTSQLAEVSYTGTCITLESSGS